MAHYDFTSVEARWRSRWAQDQVYRTPVPGEGRPTFYCLDFFPYPSGSGLSVGHGRNYVPSDVMARYHRMRGDAVLHPMGWDAFGLPAENEAINKGTHPAVSTQEYAANYRRQLDMLGCSYDWEREVSSANPDYYRWTQWLFLLFYKRGLAYRGIAPVNWCEQCQTVLADEEIEEGACWRCHQPVVQRPQQQWFLRTTAYAEELHAGLDQLDWPEPVTTLQRNWIGKSEGAEIDIAVPGAGSEVKIFTTRPDTYFGVTFVALAPEHPLAIEIAAPEHRAEVEAYVQRARMRREMDRRAAEPDGVPTGAEAVLPGIGRRVPIFIADYVLAGHGSGAIMGVPAHDTRDFAFARRFGLAAPVVVAPPTWNGAELPEVYTAAGTTVNSGQFDGMPSEKAIGAITGWLQEIGAGRPVTHYRLRDWLVSRQRYWGAPVPIVHCPSCGEVPVPEEELPVLLPPVPDYRPRGNGRSPLANLPEFVNTTCPHCGGPAERETDTLTGFVCSSWYYLRFTSPHDQERAFDPEQVARWMPVDLYMGGVEHAIGHLMYSRFFTKMLADAGLVSFREPFPVLRSQGVLHVRDDDGHIVRMSKSRGNVITPDSVVARFGADVTRLHILFIAPFDASAVWEVEEDGTPQHIDGVRRFLERVWRLVRPGPEGQSVEQPEMIRAMHRTIQEVTAGTEALCFNTSISTLMTFAGLLEKERQQHGDTPTFGQARRTLVLLLAPFAPYIAEEAWEALGEPYSVHHQPWPAYDPALARAQEVQLAVQVDGKVRDRISVPAEASEEAVRTVALASPAVQKALNGRPVKNVIVGGRVVSVVGGGRGEGVTG